MVTSCMNLASGCLTSDGTVQRTLLKGSECDTFVSYLQPRNPQIASETKRHQHKYMKLNWNSLQPHAAMIFFVQLNTFCRPLLIYKWRKITWVMRKTDKLIGICCWWICVQIIVILSLFQLNAQFLYSITIYMLHYNPRHVSSSTMLVFRRSNYIITASGWERTHVRSQPTYCTAVYRDWRYQTL